MKDYYSILRVRRFAGIAEVRRAYRTLVQQYHPDVNSDPSAAIIIREINEAYEILGDQQKKNQYDALLINPDQQQTTEPQPAHRDPRYRRNYRPVKKENRQLELITEYLPVAIKISWAGCILSFFLLIDFSLPRHIEHDVVRSLYKETKGRVTTNYVVFESGKIVKIRYEDMNALNRGRPVDIIKSFITRTTLTLYYPEKDYRITSLATLYRNYVFVPIVLMITSVLCLFLKNAIEFRFNLGIVSGFMLIFTIILMFK